MKDEGVLAAIRGKANVNNVMTVVLGVVYAAVFVGAPQWRD